jgi:hypothetical protein
MASGGGIKVSAVQVNGAAALYRQLKELGVSPEAIKAANKETGSKILSESLNEVPVRSGLLRSTIRMAELQNKVVIRAGRKSVPYANPIHWGWFKRGIKPNPFFSRVLGWNREEILANYKKQMDKLIKSTTPPKP